MSVCAVFSCVQTMVGSLAMSASECLGFLTCALMLLFSFLFWFCCCCCCCCFAKYIIVGCLFRNIHPSLQYSSRSRIHAPLYDMYTLHYASSPWSQCTCTSCTLPLPFGHSVHVHPALCLFPLVTVYMTVHPALCLFPLVTVCTVFLFKLRHN